MTRLSDSQYRNPNHIMLENDKKKRISIYLERHLANPLDYGAVKMCDCACVPFSLLNETVESFKMLQEKGIKLSN